MYMGIDYGRRRVGIAIGDSETRIAFPRETIDVERTPVMDRLAALIKENRITALVLGLPRKFGPGPSRETEVLAFREELQQRFDLPISLHDESFSSARALERTSHLSTKRKKTDKGLVDRAAAAIVLQEFLDTLPH